MLIIAAETSWIKSRVNWGANSARSSLRFKTNAMTSPDIKPASEGVRKVNIMEIASRTFTCNDRTPVVIEVIANSSKKVVRGGSEFLLIEINAQ